MLHGNSCDTSGRLHTVHIPFTYSSCELRSRGNRNFDPRLRSPSTYRISRLRVRPRATTHCQQLFEGIVSSRGGSMLARTRPRAVELAVAHVLELTFALLCYSLKGFRPRKTTRHARSPLKIGNNWVSDSYKRRWYFKVV